MTIRYRYSGAGLQGFARFDGVFSKDVLRGLYRSILRIRRILRLRHDLGVNWAGIGVVLDLLAKIEELEREIAQLRQSRG